LIGFDGLIVNVTYWDINYRGLITNQQTQANVPQLSTFAPIGGWTPDLTGSFCTKRFDRN